MSAIKIVFFDIDGTLIDMNKKRISEKMLDDTPQAERKRHDYLHCDRQKSDSTSAF